MGRHTNHTDSELVLRNMKHRGQCDRLHHVATCMHSTNTCKIERKSEMEVVLEWKSEMEVNLEWKSEIEVRNKRVEVEDPSQPPYGRSKILFQYSIPVVQYSSPVFHRIKTPLYNEYKTALRQRCVLYCFVVGVYYIFYANYVL